MQNRKSLSLLTDNPLIDSPYVELFEKDLSNFPVNNDWLLLNGGNFLGLNGQDMAFLGPF